MVTHEITEDLQHHACVSAACVPQTDLSQLLCSMLYLVLLQLSVLTKGPCLGVAMFWGVSLHAGAGVFEQQPRKISVA